MDHKEFSARGGRSTLSSHGKEFYARIGKLGGATNLKKYGKLYFQELSKLGLEARKAKKGLVDKQADV